MFYGPAMDYLQQVVVAGRVNPLYSSYLTDSSPFKCGGCFFTTHDISALHFHLQSHPEGGSYYYNSNYKIAFPKYDTVCMAVQTDQHTVQTDQHTVQTDQHLVQTDLHTVQTDQQTETTTNSPIKQDLEEDKEVEDIAMSPVKKHKLTSKKSDTKTKKTKTKNGKKAKSIDTESKEIDDFKDDIEIKVEQETNSDDTETYNDDDTEDPTFDINYELSSKTKSTKVRSRKTKQSEESFACHGCDLKSYKNAKTLKKHILQNHSKDPDLICQECLTPFLLENDKATHVCQKEVVFHTCILCKDGKGYMSRSLLVKHFDSHHESKYPFSCEHCSKPLVSEFDKKTHARKHTEQGPHICTICDKTLSTRFALVLHIKMHAGDKSFKCHLCDKAFYQRGRLRQHLLIHTGTKTAICQFCGRGFHNKEKLCDHIRGCQKKFECTVCGKKVADNHNLKLHMRTHTGEKPLVCETCGFACAHQSVLQRHIQYMHTHEKNYPCSFCEKRFVTYDNMLRHERVHKKICPFVCGYCSKAFSQRTNLKTHIRKHTGEKPYKCQVCEAAFTYNVVRKNHQAKCQASNLHGYMPHQIQEPHHQQGPPPQQHTADNPLNLAHP